MLWANFSITSNLTTTPVATRLLVPLQQLADLIIKFHVVFPNHSHFQCCHCILFSCLYYWSENSLLPYPQTIPSNPSRDYGPVSHAEKGFPEALPQNPLEPSARDTRPRWTPRHAPSSTSGGGPPPLHPTTFTQRKPSSSGTYTYLKLQNCTTAAKPLFGFHSSIASFHCCSCHISSCVSFHFLMPEDLKKNHVIK